MSALAAACNLEVRVAAGSPSTAPGPSSSTGAGSRDTAGQTAVGPGSACTAAHNELLRLCVSALGRAFASPATGRSAAAAPGRSTAADASCSGAAAGAAAQDAVTALVAVLEACVGGGVQLLADPAASTFYWTLTKTLRILMPEVCSSRS